MATTSTSSSSPYRTNLGPLTTPFTVPSSCTIAMQRSAIAPSAWLAQRCSTNSNVPLIDDEACWPPRSTNPVVPVPSPPFNGWGLYSPGLVCPVGHTTCAMATAGVQGGFGFQFAPTGAETAAGCCPEGFGCVTYAHAVGTALFQTCTQLLSAGGAEVLAGVCEGDGSSVVTSALVLPATVTSEVTTTSGSGGTGVDVVTVVQTQSRMVLWAPMIQLVWQASDKATMVGTALETSSKSTALLPSTTGGATLTPDNSEGSGSGGLSTGAVAGIAVAMTALGIAAVLAVFWGFVVRHRRRQQHQGQSDMLSYAPKSEVVGEGNGNQAPHEVHSTPKRHELAVPVAELG